MKKTMLIIALIGISFGIKAQESKIELDPKGSASGDLVGFKATETGNNTTKLHIYRNFTNNTDDIDLITINASGNTQFMGDANLTGNSKFQWDPLGNAGGDFIGFKVSETGNNTTKLHIYRNFTGDSNDVSLLAINAVGDTQFKGNANLTGNSRILWDPLGNAGGDFVGFKVSETGNNTTKFHIFKNFTGDNNDVDRLVIGSNGYVGIGTSNPDMKLTVKGNIHAEEVKIDLNVPAPDYVFKEGYNLRSLKDVENFIKKNSHLPEIPSAKEFEQNGVMQAKMDMTLLKKIEELTLYTIQQEKKIKELESLNDKLLEIQKRLQKLEKK
ncbi:tail fiber protein [Flavivirga aquimarina]|uniref:Tail fiber protein n=1 Tax=Flavivirga aquimarina TaxID=2027862 RepID=A0ABT8W979_9FLAO|nr:tail fiber protein [Flavivirga aquimarina]MDO5969624.1 tail fiber protein [Flavivirga aquimarina]